MVNETITWEINTTKSWENKPLQIPIFTASQALPIWHLQKNLSQGCHCRTDGIIYCNCHNISTALKNYDYCPVFLVDPPDHTQDILRCCCCPLVSLDFVSIWSLLALTRSSDIVFSLMQHSRLFSLPHLHGFHEPGITGCITFLFSQVKEVLSLIFEECVPHRHFILQFLHCGKQHSQRRLYTFVTTTDESLF